MVTSGMNKIVLNHLEKLFVTHDAATIMKELEVIHPAAKMVVMAADAQEKEVCRLNFSYLLLAPSSPPIDSSSSKRNGERNEILNESTHTHTHTKRLVMERISSLFLLESFWPKQKI